MMMLIKKMVLAVCLSLSITLVYAGDVLSLKAGYPQSYVVKKGDTLWAISGIFLEDPWLWPELWHYNPQVANPHLIYPGDVLALKWVNGRPVLVRNPLKSDGVVKLSAEMRIADVSDAIAAIPLDVIGPFLNNSRVVTDEELESAPYVLAGKNGNIVAGAGDQILGRGHFEDIEAYGVYRRGKAYSDPKTGEQLGVEAIDIGTANLLDSEGDIATLALNRSTQEIRRADRFLALEDRQLHARFHPQAADISDGYIIAVDGGVTQVASMDVVTLNLGERNDLEPGDVMAIYTGGIRVRDPVTNEWLKTPDVRAGVLMVFRTFEKVSYALVLKAEQALKVGDKVKSPS